MDNQYKIKITHITEDPHRYQAFITNFGYVDYVEFPDTYQKAYNDAKRIITHLRKKAELDFNSF